MMKAFKNLLIFAVSAFFLFSSGCANNNNTATSNVNILSSSENPESLQVQKTYSDKRISEEFSKEQAGIVYNGYLVSDYNLLCGGWTNELSLFKICDLLDIETSFTNQKPNEIGPEYRYQGNFVPESFYIKKDTSKLTIKVKGKISDYSNKYFQINTFK